MANSTFSMATNTFAIPTMEDLTPRIPRDPGVLERMAQQLAPGICGRCTVLSGQQQILPLPWDEYVRHPTARGLTPGIPEDPGFLERMARRLGHLGPNRTDQRGIYYPGNAEFYIFHGDEYVRHSYGRGPDPRYPKKWGVPGVGGPVVGLRPYVQAALYYPANEKIYLFQNDDYVRHSYGRGPDPEYPMEIDGTWSGWPREKWRDPPGEHLIRIDAALVYPGL